MSIPRPRATAWVVSVRASALSSTILRSGSSSGSCCTPPRHPAGEALHVRHVFAELGEHNGVPVAGWCYVISSEAGPEAMYPLPSNSQPVLERVPLEIAKDFLNDQARLRAAADVPAASYPTTYQPPMATFTHKELEYLIPCTIGSGRRRLGGVTHDGRYREASTKA